MSDNYTTNRLQAIKDVDDDTNHHAKNVKDCCDGITPLIIDTNTIVNLINTNLDIIIAKIAN